MRKYYLRYLFFWAPAFFVACFFNNPSMLSQILQWFFAFFMLFGWAVNSAMAAYHFPRTVFSSLLVYLGVNLLITTGLYHISSGSAMSRLLMRIGGLLSFTPLDIVVTALLDFTIPHEVYVVAAVTCVCLAGWLAGVAYRRIHPNPYRPRISK